MKTVLTSFTILCLLFTVFLMELAPNIQQVKASGTIYIRADGSVEPDTAPISTVDNITYTLTGNIVGDVPEWSSAIVVQRDNIVIDGAGYTLRGTRAHYSKGIFLFQRNNVTHRNMTIRWFDSGIYLLASSNIIIVENNIKDNYDGVLLGTSSKYIIARNNIANNHEGVLLYSCWNNTIVENNIKDNYSGIYLYNCSNNIIAENNIANSGEGIYMTYSTNNNTIYGNNIAKNNQGIYLSGTSNNIFLHNDFVANIQQVVSNISTNLWDDGYPSGGNYWSDNNGTDLYSGLYQNETGGDGITDRPYVLDAKNTDNYPLMGGFSDFNATSEYHVQTICNSTISDLQFNRTAISFNVMGEDGTSGFCRICIPTALLNDTYKVFVNGTKVPHTLLPCSNSTHNYLYFTYPPSTQEVIIIPEFSSFLILPLFMILSLLAAILYKRDCLYC